MVRQAGWDPSCLWGALQGGWARRPWGRCACGRLAGGGLEGPLSTAWCWVRFL